MGRFERLDVQLNPAKLRAHYVIQRSISLTALLLYAGQLLEEAALILDHCVKQEKDWPQHCDWISCCHSYRHTAHANARMLCDFSAEIPEQKADGDDICTSPPKGRMVRQPDDTSCHNPHHPGYKWNKS